MSRSTWGLVYALAPLALGALDADARADGPAVPAAIEVVVDGEPGALDEGGMIDALRLELGMDGVRAIRQVGDAGPGDVAVIHLAVRDGPPRLEVRLEHRARGRTIVRELDLSDVPTRSWSRTIALSVAELVRGSWEALARMPASEPSAGAAAEVTARTRPEAAVESPPDATAEGPARVDPRGARAGRALAIPRGDPSEWEAPPSGPPVDPDATAHGGAPTLAAAFVARGFPTADLALLGGQIRAAFPFAPAPSFRLAASVGFARGAIDHRLGHVELLALVGAVGVDVAFGEPDWSVALGPRVAVGWARSSGEPASSGVTGHQVDAAFLLVGAAGELAVRVVGPLRAALGVEVGAAVFGVTALADEERALGIEDLALTAWAGPELELE